MASLNDKLSAAVQKGDEKKVRSLCERFSKGRTDFNPTDAYVPPGNRVFLDRTYMRFTQMASREAVLHQSSGQGWVINTTDDLLRALYGDQPDAQSPSVDVEAEKAEEVEAVEDAVEDATEPEGPLGKTEVTIHGPGD